MSQQQGLYKIMIDQHALSQNRGKQINDKIGETRKRVDACKKWAQSASSPSQKQAWIKLLNSVNKLHKDQKKDLMNYRKDAEMFDKGRKDLESTRIPRETKGPYDTASLRSNLPPVNKRKG
jgi:hypothetical protein